MDLQPAGDSRQANEAERSVRQFFDLAPHITAWSAAIAFTFVAYRIGAVSRWNMATATGLVTESGTAAVVSGVLVQALPFLLPLAALFALWRWRMGLGTSTPWRFAFDILALLALYGSPIAEVVIVVVLAMVHIAVKRIAVLRWIRWLVTFEKSDGSAVVASLVVFVFFATPTVWLPEENLSVSGKPVTAYVLSDDGRSLAYLDERSRLIVRVPTDYVAHRSICEQSSWSVSPLSKLVLGSPYHYPRCP